MVTYFLKEFPPLKALHYLRPQFQLSQVFLSSPAMAIEFPPTFQGREFIAELRFKISLSNRTQRVFLATTTTELSENWCQEKAAVAEPVLIKPKALDVQNAGSLY